MSTTIFYTFETTMNAAIANTTYAPACLWLWPVMNYSTVAIGTRNCGEAKAYKAGLGCTTGCQLSIHLR